MPNRTPTFRRTEEAAATKYPKKQTSLISSAMETLAVLRPPAASIPPAKKFKTANLPHRQFFHLYANRLNTLRPLALQVAKATKWPESDTVQYADRILDLEPDTPSVICGTVYRDCKLKPSILREYASEGAGMMPRIPLREGIESYATDQDEFYLEDEKGRIRLHFESVGDTDDVSRERVLRLWVTGMVLALKGTSTPKDGSFHVQDVCYPEVPPKEQTEVKDVKTEPAKAYLGFVSGLHVGDGTRDNLQTQILAEYIKGNLADDGVCSHIQRLVIAGDSVSTANNNGVPASFDSLLKLSAVERKRSADSMRRLDAFLASISSSVQVDLIPGAQDPTNNLLPQQPFHKCLLPYSSQTGHLTAHPNPFYGEMVSSEQSNKLRVLGTAGQNLDDWARGVCIQTKGSSKAKGENDEGEKTEQLQVDLELIGEHRLDLLEQMLRCAHVAPTAPDTLGAHPSLSSSTATAKTNKEETSSDPFALLDPVPDILFAGNQPCFAHRIANVPTRDGKGTARVLLLCIPRFADSQQMVVVEPATFNIRIISF